MSYLSKQDADKLDGAFKTYLLERQLVFII